MARTVEGRIHKNLITFGSNIHYIHVIELYSNIVFVISSCEHVIPEQINAQYLILNLQVKWLNFDGWLRLDDAGWLLLDNGQALAQVLLFFVCFIFSWFFITASFWKVFFRFLPIKDCFLIFIYQQLINLAKKRIFSCCLLSFCTVGI